jgi:hypothetical protein
MSGRKPVHRSIRRQIPEKKGNLFFLIQPSEYWLCIYVRNEKGDGKMHGTGYLVPFCAQLVSQRKESCLNAVGDK